MPKFTQAENGHTGPEPKHGSPEPLPAYTQTHMHKHTNTQNARLPREPCSVEFEAAQEGKMVLWPLVGLAWRPDWLWEPELQVLETAAGDPTRTISG